MTQSNQNAFWTEMTTHIDELLKYKHLTKEDKQDMRQDILLDMFLQMKSEGNVTTIEQTIAHVEMELSR